MKKLFGVISVKDTTHVDTYHNRRKRAFTLAEVLITLGIIGVVAAITMPMLIGKYQKMVWYNQFKKAVSQLENAVKLYEVDNGCVGNISDCLGNRRMSTGDVIKYFKTSIVINGDDEICSKISDIYDGMDYYHFNCEYTPDAFITTDGILFTMWQDVGYYGNAGFIDINGPFKGPNKGGRDLFTFYAPGSYDNNKNIVWGGSEHLLDSNLNDDRCGNCNNSGCGEGCATKLLQEGKMNY